MNRTGRTTVVYCNGWTPNSRTLLHEVLLTDELIAMLIAMLKLENVSDIHSVEILRGPKVDRDLRADATVFINTPFHEQTGELHYELDNGSEHMKQLRDKMENLKLFIDPVVWVFQQPERMQDVMSFSTANSYFKLYGHQEIFNSHGQVVFQRP